ncbi:MAG TPA: hypothetical protein VE396_02380 [Xanthobacteraceae bacterium]|jgi:hypothetical protein|nr:hypothetical protein [Xanthobacteraceae bacterium]
MELRHQDDVPARKPATSQKVPHDWARLIRKLRWIGLEEEAKSLEAAVSTIPSGERGDVNSGPFSTD